MTVIVSSTNSEKSKHPKIFDHMVALIQDEIDDTTDEYSIQIENSIFAALRLCKREPLFFNQDKKITFETKNGKTWYGKKEGIFIPTKNDIKNVFLQKNNKTKKTLIYKTLEILEKQYPIQEKVGKPIFYTWDNQKIGIFPTPNKTETVNVYCNSDSYESEIMIREDDPWMIYAFDFIKARAKYELYKNILKDPEYAAVAFNDFQEQLKLLRTETSRKKGLSIIIPMGF
ncbi:hypothetical protein [Bartonella sp. CB189]|uniref:hypothetical protein n=1 Tax=Bartonella sp. CB189 TaxID=3112254 RepID=UPI002F96DF1D